MWSISSIRRLNDARAAWDVVTGRRNKTLPGDRPFFFCLLWIIFSLWNRIWIDRSLGQRADWLRGSKMGCLGSSKTEDQRIDEKAQREANKKIEKQLQKERQAYKATHRLLLLGKRRLEALYPTYETHTRLCFQTHRVWQLNLTCRIVHMKNAHRDIWSIWETLRVFTRLCLLF